MSFSRGSSQPTEANPGLPHCSQILYRLSHQGLTSIQMTWRLIETYFWFSRSGVVPWNVNFLQVPAAAADKSLQSHPTLCDPRDGSPPGSPVPGILQARTLESVAISFSNAWKWKVKVKALSRVRLPATPWTVAYQAPPSMGFSRQEYWSGVPLPSPSLKLHRPFIIALFVGSSRSLKPLCLSTDYQWRRKWHPTPVFLPGESHGQRTLVGCRLWGPTESETTEAT